MSSTYLQGGLISQVFPGTGIFYRYYKFRNNSKISFLEYSFSQTFLSIFSLSCIFFLTITFWFLKIFGIKFSTLIFFFILVFTAIYSIYICKNKIFKFFKKKILHIKKVKKYFNELKKIKNIIFFNKSYFQFIFILFFFLTILRCFIFYTATKKFAFDVGLLDAFFIYLNSIFLSTLLSMNFIGFYEVILTIIASFITDNFFDIMFIGLSLRLLNIFSIFFWILLFSTIKKIRAKIEIEQLRKEEKDPKINFKFNEVKKDLNCGMGFVNPHSTD